MQKLRYYNNESITKNYIIENDFFIFYFYLFSKIIHLNFLIRLLLNLLIIKKNINYFQRI